MGEQSRAHNIFRTLHALGASLSAMGATVDVPAGVSALEKSLEALEGCILPADQSASIDRTIDPSAPTQTAQAIQSLAS